MKYLNEILISWNQQENNPEGIIDTETVSDRISRMDFDEWVAKYTWSKKEVLTRISEDRLTECLKMIYEVLEPYTETFLWMLVKVINDMHNAKHCKTMHWRARLNCSSWLLLFNEFPRRFNADKNKWILESFNKTLSSFSDQELHVLNIIRLKAEKNSYKLRLPDLWRFSLRDNYTKFENWNVSVLVLFKIINPTKEYTD
jgi:hypothetical protein